MYLEHISISNFKNIGQVDINFSPSLNCFVGDNGEGKTNLLDAVYYLSMCKSYFLTNDSQNIYNSEDFFLIKGSYVRNNTEEQISCGFKRGGNKSLKRNGKEYERLSAHIGFIPLVMISPSDTSLINDRGEERRKYINAIISQIDNEYLNSLIRYNHALQQRNKLLKNSRIDCDLLEILNKQLSCCGKLIYERRNNLVKDLLPVFQKVYNSISGNKEEVLLAYKSDLEHYDFNLLLEENFERDKFLQHTSKGIHRDDMYMELNGRQVRRAASQGQQKNYLIALKIAQFHFIKQNAGLPPILLLDDIFDKLDPNRVELLIKLVAGNEFGQIFLTDSNKNRLDHLLEKIDGDYSLFTVKNGDITKTYKRGEQLI
jgi:DNA replication and repair protein RecF